MEKPRDKGKIENGVQNVERWIIAPLRNRQFFSMHEVNLAVKEKLEQLNNKVYAVRGSHPPPGVRKRSIDRHCGHCPKSRMSMPREKLPQ